MKCQTLAGSVEGGFGNILFLGYEWVWSLNGDSHLNKHEAHHPYKFLNHEHWHLG